MNNAEEILKNFDWNKYPHLKAYSNLMKVPSRDVIGRDKEIRAIKAAFNRPELCNVCLLAPAGSGKALADDEMIAVNDARGYVRMGDLNVGDTVFDEHGEPTTVVGVFPQGLKPAYRVTLTNGASLVCNDEHLWNARTASGHKKGYGFETVTLRKMMEHGIRHRKVKKSTGAVSYHTEWYIPAAEAVHREAANLPVDPYAVGAFIGDGRMSGQKCDDLVFSSGDTYVVDKVARLLGGMAVRGKADCNWQLKNVVDGAAVSMKSADVFADEMFEHTFRHAKSVDRSIPEPYLLGSVEQRRALLNGLMDMDGCVTNGYRADVSFFTNSEALCMDMVRLASSLGYMVSHTWSGGSDEAHANTEYEVRFDIADERKCELFTLPRQLETLDERISKRDAVESDEHFEDIGIASVEYLGVSVPMTCIYVDAPSHLFQAGYDHIVTHNTALVQGTMMADTERIYLEIDLAKMIADCQTDVNEMASKLKAVFDETATFVEAEGYQIVLFIDEFHQIVQLSAAAVEALKPLLADSGRRGIRVIVATTLEEFNEFISSNQPLVERLLRINVPEPDEAMTVSILKGMAKTYGVDNQFYDDHVFHMIYEYTNRYIPSSSQPRKSIKVLDAMIGWHLAERRPMNDKLLADVIQESEDVNIAFRVDATSIKKRLDEKVLAQDFASEQIARRLQLCVADLNNPDKPMSTMLFTGSTGVGKQVSDDTPVPIIDDGGKTHWKNHGDLQVGDMVVARDGSATRVLGVYPHKDIPMYRVTLTDGRTLDVGDEHLWAVYSAKQRHKIQNEGRSDIKPQILSTVDLVDKGVVRTYAKDSRRHIKWFIPMNEAVQWPELCYDVHPYVVGAFIGNGCLREQTLTLSSDDVETVNRVAEYLGSPDVLQSKWSYSWKFFLPDDYSYAGPRREYYKTDDVFGDMPELFEVKSAERRIPGSYMHGSIEQRWALVRGLFDTDGTVSDDDRCRVAYSTFSVGLAQDVRMLLLSLGVSSTITCSTRTREKADGDERVLVEYTVHVKASMADKAKFFDLTRKRDIVDKWSHLDKRQRVKKFDMVGIADIEYIGRQDAKCIYVENDEHLYQAGEFVVTHNTEMTKQLAEILFGDQRRLLRFDMTEYANDDSLERFRDLLTTRIWEHPYSIVLLDEIEKACAPVTRLLLQVLDDGRLTNRNNREVSFTNCYIIITTNAGSEIYKTIAHYGASDEGSAQMAKRYDKLIRRSLTETSENNKFPPELIGRIDVLVPFQPLSRNTMKAIVKMKLQKLKKTVMERHGVDVRIDKRVIDYLVEDNLSEDSNSGGARIVVSKLESEVTTEVAKFINENEFVRRIVVKVEGQMAIENKNKLESAAYIKVLAC